MPMMMLKICYLINAVLTGLQVITMSITIIISSLWFKNNCDANDVHQEMKLEFKLNLWSLVFSNDDHQEMWLEFKLNDHCCFNRQTAQPSVLPPIAGDPWYTISMTQPF